jgi:hypothetical protein
MRAPFVAAIISALAVAAAAAQSTTPPPPAQSGKSPKSLTLTGCVAPESGNAGHFTLNDFTTGTTTYRLTGTDVRRYLGKRVELVGATTVQPKLKIVGGLTPSPNVAAQAGAMDPAEAARANLGAQGDARPGNILVPELNVKTIKAVAGACRPPQ